MLLLSCQKVVVHASAIPFAVSVSEAHTLGHLSITETQASSTCQWSRVQAKEGKTATKAAQMVGTTGYAFCVKVKYERKKRHMK